MDEFELKEFYKGTRESMVKWLIQQDRREFMRRNRHVPQKKKEELFKETFGKVYVETHKDIKND